MTQTDDLLETMQKLRMDSFPELPEELVAKIIGIEQEHLNDRPGANKAIQAVITEFLEKGESDAAS